MLCEDVPQIALTWMISRSFVNASGLAVFNITTSIYSLIIQFMGELFLKMNWCCVLTDEDEDMDEPDAEEPAYMAKER